MSPDDLADEYGEWKAAQYGDHSTYITDAEYAAMESYGTPPWEGIETADTWGEQGVAW